MKQTILFGFLAFFLVVGIANAANGHAHASLGAEVDASGTAVLGATTTMDTNATATEQRSATGSAMSGRSHGAQGMQMSEEHRSATGTAHAQNENHMNGTTTAHGNSLNAHASSTGKITSEMHRSDVAAVVENLKALASKHQGIGQDVSAVAKAQADSNDSVSDAMAKVASRGSFKTFFIGPDYKNLGVIRSELATTDNSIDRLKKAESRADDASVKANLEAQITALQNTQVETKSFVKAHADSFSLFGWFAKLFG